LRIPEKTRPSPWLETLRLELRVFVESDLDDLYRLDRDPRVMKYIADGKPASREAVAQRLKRFLRYATLYPDLGIWRAARRDTGAYIGWFALNYAGNTTDIEVGYRLLPGAWGQGFATEGAKAIVDTDSTTSDSIGSLGLRTRQQGVATRVAEGRTGRRRLGTLLQSAAAPLRRRTRCPLNEPAAQSRHELDAFGLRALAQSGSSRSTRRSCWRMYWRRTARGSSRTPTIRSPANRRRRSSRSPSAAATASRSPI
jgi:hypothetical protein